MEPLPQSARKFPKLSEPINQRLNMYALAAGAAGVGILASAHPAEAKIVYTPSHIRINVNGALVNLDLNHDGISDFQFYAGYQGPGVPGRGFSPQEGNHGSNLEVTPAQPSNRVWAVESKNVLCAAALPRGTRVGSHGPFQPGHSSLPMAFANGNSTGGAAFCPWLKVQQAFVGLKFVIQGKVHFGWARIKRVSGLVGFPAVITGYAYETVPNKPIVTGKRYGANDAELTIAASGSAPKPASLGLLAMGSPTVSIWRRKAQLTNAQ
jgi:hypothetical protein